MAQLAQAESWSEERPRFVELVKSLRKMNERFPKPSQNLGFVEESILLFSGLTAVFLAGSILGHEFSLISWLCGAFLRLWFS